MKIALGLILFVVGLAVTLAGMGSAVRDLASIYTNALESPLDDPVVGGDGNARGAAAPGAAVGEKAISDRMLHSVAWGAIGIPPLIIGSVLLKWGLWSKWRSRRARRAELQRQYESALAGSRDPRPMAHPSRGVQTPPAPPGAHGPGGLPRR